MSKYNVSLIVPCYNIESIDSEKEDPFKSMFLSIKKQTFGFENIEVLFIDDKSTDNTTTILNKLSEKYGNVKSIFLEKNTGRPSIPRNVGIKNASTDYIMFLDQDDKLELDCVDILYKEIIKEDVDFVKSNYSILDGTKIRKYDSGKNERIELEPKSPDMFYATVFIWGAIYKRDFLLNNNINFPDAQAEDVLFLTNCINSTTKKIIILNNYYSVIYTANNNQSLSHTFTKKQIEDYIKIHSCCIDEFIKNKQNVKFISEFISNSLIVIIGSILRSDKNKKTKKDMIDITYDFIKKYQDYNILLTGYWNIMYKLILNKQYTMVILSSNIIQSVFEKEWFKKRFRNQNYEN